jgi:hypothetical protein
MAISQSAAGSEAWRREAVNLQSLAQLYPRPAIILKRHISCARNGTKRMERNIGKDATPPYPAEKASQGEIILKRPWQRAVFIGGLAAAILLPLIVLFLAR